MLGLEDPRLNIAACRIEFELTLSTKEYLFFLLIRQVLRKVFVYRLSYFLVKYFHKNSQTYRNNFVPLYKTLT